MEETKSERGEIDFVIGEGLQRSEFSHLCVCRRERAIVKERQRRERGLKETSKMKYTENISGEKRDAKRRTDVKDNLQLPCIGIQHKILKISAVQSELRDA